jgi:hypothetical protein
LHHHVDLTAAAESLDRGAAGVAGRGDHDGRALTTYVQRVIHQPRHQLHGEILEGERRSVEQLQYEQAGAELNEGSHRRVTEGSVGFARHAGEIGLGQAVPHERPDHLDRHFGIGFAGQASNRAIIERRPGLGYVKSAIARQAGQHDLDEIKGRGLAPR